MFRYLLLLCFPLQCVAQLPDTTAKKIDDLFKNLNNNTPGCAVAVTKNGNVIFQKGYGMANLEYAAPVSAGTIFHIASVSKQYVAFCMLLLEKEGKLNIDDDIRKYLDYVPDFGHRITIRQLINHTSGLRDQWQLLANAGWQLDDVITQQHIIKAVAMQRALNFKPGDEFMYCNTGYTLMAEIVKKVSGLTLREYTDKNIFKPLDMNDTHFHDNYKELVPGRAYSYFPKMGPGFEHAVLSYSTVGATSLFTTVIDEVKWLHNYSTGAVGGKDLIEKMYLKGVLNDGRKLTYAGGVAVEEYKGWKTIGHSGGDAGYSTYAIMFPEEGLNIAIFSNSSYANPYELTYKIADIILPSGRKEKPADPLSVNADTAFVKKFQGRFYSDRGDLVQLNWQRGKLVRSGGSNSPELELKRLGENRYTTEKNGPVLILDPNNVPTDSIQQFTLEFPTRTIRVKRLQSNPSVKQSEYAGRYYNKETEAFYTVAEKDGRLQMEHRKFNTVNLNYFAPDQYKLPHWWMSHIVFLRDDKGRVTGFEVNSGRILHLRYDKVE